MSEQKPLTMSAEREVQLRIGTSIAANPMIAWWLSELDAERAAHAETRERVAALREQLAQARRFIDVTEAQAQWSQATFGTDSECGPIGPLKHLAKEVQETLANIEDEMEYVDCFLLVLDASRRRGMTANRLLDLAFEKLEINRRRRWNKPTSDDPVEHDRSGEARYSGDSQIA